MSDLSHPPEHDPLRDTHDVEHGHDDHEHGGFWLYMGVFAALCVLTGASFFTYSDYWPFQEEGQEKIAWAFMMAVSCTKAMLVIMFFMHLLWEANWKWVLTVPATFMSIFLMLMLVPDIAWRQDTGYATYSRDRLLHAADPPQVTAAKQEVVDQEPAHPAHRAGER